MTITWITTQDWAAGKFDLPRKGESAQAYIRTKKKIKYTKNGRSVVYQKQWILDYLNNNIREPRDK